MRHLVVVNSLNMVVLWFHFSLCLSVMDHFWFGLMSRVPICMVEYEL